MRWLAAILFALTAGVVQAGCGTGSFDGLAYSWCDADPARDDLRLWHSDAEGAVIGSFARLDDMLRADGRALVFAMNGGMYHDDRRPVGHYIEDGREVMRLVTSAGPGNFGLLPNGVFCLGPEGASILETTAFAQRGPECTHATQSGPMLVMGGDLHPKLLPTGTSRNIRNGVGVRPDGTVVLAISDEPVTFHHFARLFRDRLGAPDALFIDGRVSRLFAPEIGRHDLGLPMGPILGVAAPPSGKG